ncbi:Beta-lactamase [Brachybacterium nesterenkovii]|uniref:Beta-lactamase n=1 Tax=Brachybacterium nesterenkovii TaxID=47847 RepID=A0A1X6WVF7_9MICO|nr:Beta-lactamase [Brachybacterium nesterenkovii]
MVDAGAAPLIAWALVDADGTVLAEHESARPFYAASTIKLHVLLAALRAVDAGDIELDATIPATRTFGGVDGSAFTLAGDHLDPTHPADGTPVSVRELLVRMIDRSSNEATNTVIDLVGLDAVEAVIEELGLRATRAERRIGDAAAIARGFTNETCAADLAETMRRIVRREAGVPAGPCSKAGLVAGELGTTAETETFVGPGTTAETETFVGPGTPRGSGAPWGPKAPARKPGPGLLSPASTGLALDALRAQRMRVILDVLPEGLDAGSKSGEVDGFRHDVAFIGDPCSEDLRCLAVMTSGLTLAEADDTIRRTARELLGNLAD